MKVSVIIAAYNVENYIDRCIESIRNQTLKDIEIIVVNDGSTDRTIEKIEKIKKDDDRIILLNQKNKGSIEARKFGLKNASGDYIIFIDADDWIDTNSLEILYNRSKCNNSDITLYNYFINYDNGEEISINKYINSNISTENCIEYLLTEKINLTLWSTLIRRSYIYENNIIFPKNISIGEDIATLLSLLSYNPKICVVDECLYHYYQREDSITKRPSSKLLDVNKAIIFMESILLEKSIYSKYKSEFDYTIYKQLFDYACISYNKVEKVNKLVYADWKSRRIKIYRNKYIISEIKNGNINRKIRIFLYNLSFDIGNIYDFFRLSVKKLLKFNKKVMN